METRPTYGRKASIDEGQRQSHWSLHDPSGSYQPTITSSSNSTSAVSNQQLSSNNLQPCGNTSNSTSQRQKVGPDDFGTIDQNLLEVFFDEFDEEDRDAYLYAPRSAPITKQSLSELDIGSIINNSKLRHDVNFDRELHFRPNMDGDRGIKKRTAQIRYWRAICIELRLIYHVFQTPVEDELKPRLIARCSSRLRLMFETTKDILKNLVPERDHADVDEHLDVAMIMQEISHGVCNFVSIAEWLARLLKKHCAPMRDELVDRMVTKVSKETPDSIAAGLADLFTVLEAMKLDVANHQIRHLRALLIEDSINFERKYHCSRIRKHKYRCRDARRWYKSILQSRQFTHPPMTQSWPNCGVEAFVRGLLKLLMPTTDAPPDTFILDHDRIKQLKDDIDEHLRDTLCCGVLKEILQRRGAEMTSELELAFRQRLHSISGAPRPPRWHCHALDDIACETVRFVLQNTGSDEITNEELERAACEMLEARLWATVNARVVATPQLKDLEDRERIEKHGRDLYNQLFPHIFRTVEEFLTRTPYDIFLALVPPPAPPPTCPTTLTTVRLLDRNQDLVRRIAHIAVLHWRTWENLVYNNTDFDQDVEDDQLELDQPGSSTPHGVSMSHVYRNSGVSSQAVHTEPDTVGERLPTEASAG